jgi:tagatose-1,6-bisphosphate aldolase
MPSIDDLRDASGAIVGVAVDHRDTFTAALLDAGYLEISPEAVARIKLDVCDALAPTASMLLIDDATLQEARSHDRELAAPFAMPLEAQGYGALHEVEHTRLLDWPTPSAMAEAGAVAAKLLLPIRLDHRERATAQLEVARRAVEQCHRDDLPLILEPIVWEYPDDVLEPARRAELIVETAARLAPLHPGILKLQYPGSAGTCAALHEACAGHPWLLLGGGAPIGELERQVAEARAAGAQGVIAGRTLFAGALTPDRQERLAWLREHARPALDRLVAAARPAGHPPAPSESRT